MYTTLVRPHIEYGHTIIYPRYEKDKKFIEGVQRRATKIKQELKDKEYPDRLKTLKLPSMQYRRDRGDMIFSPFRCLFYTKSGGHYQAVIH